MDIELVMKRLFVASPLLIVVLSMVPLTAKSKPSPVYCSANYAVCLSDVRWKNNREGITGVLENRSSQAFRFTMVRFSLKEMGGSFTSNAADVIAGSATDTYAESLPPGGRWKFRASIPVNANYSDSVTIRVGPEEARIQIPNRLWNDTYGWARGRWEKRQLQ
jgi:hypothetical protein